MGTLARHSTAFAFRTPTRRGWHRHHLLPNHPRRYVDLRDFLGRLGGVGLDPGDFGTNGMFLPAEEAIARSARLPLHRGPHRRYNAIVVEALDSLYQDTARLRLDLTGQLVAVRGLQRRLRGLLQLSALDTEVALAGRDPFGPIPLAAALDRQTDALFAEALRIGVDQVASACPST